jgi:hypothetical protein
MKKYLLIVLTLVFTLLSVVIHPSYAVVSGGTGKVILTPQAATLPVGSSQNIVLHINTAGTAVSSISIRATFPVSSNDLEVISITPNNDLVALGWTFPIKTATTVGGTTTIDIGALNFTTTGYQTSTDVPLATIAFRANNAFATKTLTFDTGETKMLKKIDSTDILGAPTNGSYAAGGTGGATSTPTVTPTLTPTGTGGSDSGGNTIPTCASLYSDITTGTGTPQTVTFTCSGVDPNGYINAAEFVFGDGTSQVVEKNVGSPGSIATTHTYNTIGSLGASCRVRDNTGAYSSIPENCRKIITIKQGTKVTATPSPIGGKLTATPIATSTPTIEETPAPTPLPTEVPIEENTDSGSSNRIWWILGGAVAMLAAFLLLRRKPPHPPMPPQVPPVPPMNPPTDVAQPVQPQV